MRKILTILVLSSVFISFDNGIYARVDDARLKKMYGKTYGSIAVVFRRKFYAGVNAWNRIYKNYTNNFTTMHIPYVELEDRNYDGIIISGISLRRANFKNIKMRKSIFKFMFFEGSFVNTDFSQSVFRRVYLEAKYIKCIFDNSRFERTIFSYSYLFSSKMVYSSFKWVSMQRSVFRRSNFISCDFSHADLRYSIFEKSYDNKISVFINCNFTNADLRNILTLNNVVFKNCDFKGVKIDRKWYNYIKRQGVRNFDKIVWSAHGR